MKLILLAATALLLIGASLAQAGPERELVDRYCRGMIKEYRWPDGTRADCISESHAIEVEFSTRWAESLGQALNSAWWTREIAANPKEYPQHSSKIGGQPRKAGIILVCLRPRPREQTCIDHYTRLYRLLEEYKLPVTIWYCFAEENKALGDCQAVDPGKKPLQINPPLPTKKPPVPNGPTKKPPVPNGGTINLPPLPTKKGPVRPVPKSLGACCHTCRSGYACGDSCITRARDCHVPRGCACDE